MTVRFERYTGPTEAKSVRNATNAAPVQVEIVRRYDTGSFLGAVFALFLGAWTGMLAMGGLHSHHAVVPAVSYFDVLLVLVLLGILGEAVRPGYRIWTRNRRS